MEKIKSVTALPDWFRNRVYRKNLTDLEWFREIRIRERCASILKMFHQAPKGSKNWILDIATGAKEPDPKSLFFFVPQQGMPISDMDAGEAIFLGFSVLQRDEYNVGREYEQLLRSWCEALEEEKSAGDGPTPKFGQYENDLATFVEKLDENKRGDWLEGPCFDHSDDRIGNPWLSYARPLNGFPVTIDTQFDDETIIKQVKLWLIEKRKAEGLMARRPYNQNDFNDWEYYKIREIFDLEFWADANDVKILDNVIANALWPNAPDNFSPIDVLRTTARKKSKDVFRFETSVRFWGQLKLTYGENFMDE